MGIKDSKIENIQPHPRSKSRAWGVGFSGTVGLSRKQKSVIKTPRGRAGP